MVSQPEQAQSIPFSEATVSSALVTADGERLDPMTLFFKNDDPELSTLAEEFPTQQAARLLVTAKADLAGMVSSENPRQKMTGKVERDAISVGLEGGTDAHVFQVPLRDTDSTSHVSYNFILQGHRVVQGDQLNPNTLHQPIAPDWVSVTENMRVDKSTIARSVVDTSQSTVTTLELSEANTRATVGMSDTLGDEAQHALHLVQASTNTDAASGLVRHDLFGSLGHQVNRAGVEHSAALETRLDVGSVSDDGGVQMTYVQGLPPVAEVINRTDRSFNSITPWPSRFRAGRDLPWFDPAYTDITTSTPASGYPGLFEIHVSKVNKSNADERQQLRIVGHPIPGEVMAMVDGDGQLLRVIDWESDLPPGEVLGVLEQTPKRVKGYVGSDSRSTQVDLPIRKHHKVQIATSNNRLEGVVHLSHEQGPHAFVRVDEQEFHWQGDGTCTFEPASDKDRNGQQITGRVAATSAQATVFTPVGELGDGTVIGVENKVAIGRTPAQQASEMDEQSE